MNVNDVFLRITTLGRVFKIHDIFGTIFDRFIKIFHALGLIARLRGSGLWGFAVVGEDIVGKHHLQVLVQVFVNNLIDARKFVAVFR